MSVSDRTTTSGFDVTAFFRRRGWILLACLVLIPGAVYAYTARLDELYEAQAIVEPRLAEQLGVSPFVQDALRLRPGVVAYYGGSGETRAAIAERLGRPIGALPSLSADIDFKTGWVRLTASGSSAPDTVAAANAYAPALDGVLERIVAENRADLVRRTRAQLEQVRDPVDREELRERLRGLEAFRVSGEGLAVLDRAESARTVAPNPGRNALLALVVAVLVAPALMFAAERLDRRVRHTEVLEEVAGAEALATIPAGALDGARPNAVAAEEFRRLRDALTVIRPDARVPVIVVAGALRADDAATVALGLARAFAEADSRVLLVDADTAGPLATILGVGGERGLVEALARRDAPASAVDVEGFAGRLRFLPAGDPGPSGTDLLASDRLPPLLTELERDRDVLVIHAAPLLQSSDALPLLRHATDAVACVRLGSTPRDAIRRLMAIVERARAPLAGVVATGARRAPRRRADPAAQPALAA